MSRIITVNNINRLWQNGVLAIKRGLEERMDKLEANGGSNIVYLSQADYDALPDTKLTDDVEYRITDAGVRGSAENVSYDNSVSGLDAKNIQEAVDEVNIKVNDSLGKKLLWTNLSPTQSFSPQTLSIDLSLYEYVFIEFARNDNKYYSTCIIRKGYVGEVISGWSVSGNATGISTRSINFIDDSSISFSDCIGSTINSSSVTCTTNNKNFIPLNIYGFNMLH